MERFVTVKTLLHFRVSLFLPQVAQDMLLRLLIAVLLVVTTAAYGGGTGLVKSAFGTVGELSQKSNPGEEFLEL